MFRMFVSTLYKHPKYRHYVSIGLALVVVVGDIARPDEVLTTRVEVISNTLQNLITFTVR